MPASPQPRREPSAREAVQGFLIANGIMLRADTARDLRNARQGIALMALALAVSVAMGAAAWAFLAALSAVSAFREAHPACYLLLPPVGVATAWVYRNHGLKASRGNNLVIDSAVTGRLIHLRMGVLTFLCSTATHLAGGSAGREGAAVQMGGTIASNVSSLFKLGDHDHHDIMLAGISSAFGAIFGTPLAGAFFGMEMCFVGKLDYAAVLYCLVASFTGDWVARALGATHGAQAIAAVPALGPRAIALAAASAVLYGLVARLFSACIRGVKRFYATRFRSYLAAALTGSLLVMAIYLLVPAAQRYAGLSEWMTGAGFRGATTPVDAAAKLGITALTLGVGFQGGEVTPLFGIGAALGGWLGRVGGIDPSLPAALGMLGVFGAALNVPVTTVMLGIDLFGGAAAPYFVITAFISYLVAGHRGVYPAQRIVSPKRRSLAGDVSGTVEDAIDARREQVAEAEERVDARLR